MVFWQKCRFIVDRVFCGVRRAYQSLNLYPLRRRQQSRRCCSHRQKDRKEQSDPLFLEAQEGHGENIIYISEVVGASLMAARRLTSLPQKFHCGIQSIDRQWKHSTLQ